MDLYRNWLELSRPVRILLVAIAYGLFIGLITIWWEDAYSETPFPPNIPGQWLGNRLSSPIYDLLADDDGSSPTGGSLPVILESPGIFVPSSILFWTATGAVVAGVGMAWERRRQ